MGKKGLKPAKTEQSASEAMSISPPRADTIKERPILFSREMVQAILSGRKTQTRRAIKPQPYIDIMGNFCWKNMNFGQTCEKLPMARSLASPLPNSKTKRVHCPYGKPGDRLWVRETWREASDEYGTQVITYRAGGNIIIGRSGPYGDDHLLNASSDSAIHVDRWKSAIHMPRWASRTLLEITGIRVERVQDIGESDVLAEGAPLCSKIRKTLACEYGHENDRVCGFSRLWDSINAKRGHGWDENPWVWVIDFRVVKF